MGQGSPGTDWREGALETKAGLCPGPDRASASGRGRIRREAPLDTCSLDQRRWWKEKIIHAFSSELWRAA